MAQGRDGIRTTANAIATLGCGLVSACALGDLNIDALPCPCADGFSCDQERGICVRGSSLPDLEPASACGTPQSSGWAFCDGFEAPGLQGWMVRRNTGAAGEAVVERQTDVVYRGKGALRARVSGTGDVAAVFATVFDTPVDDVVWMRGYFRFPGEIADIDFMGFGDDVHQEAVVLSSDATQIDVHDHRGFGSFNRIEIQVQLPLDRWFCAVLKIEVGTEGSNTVFINDVEVGVVNFDTTVTQGHTRIDVGFLDWRLGTPLPGEREVLVDEVVVATSELSCDAI